MSESKPTSPAQAVAALTAKVRDIPDFPQPGILFRDITPLLQDPATLRLAIDQLAAPFMQERVDLVVGVESRGFIFGAPLAYRLGAGFIPVRKVGKLPHTTLKVSYALEYGENIVEIHADAITPGQRVLLVDDLLATGGTMSATAELVTRLGGMIIGVAFLIELTFLEGRKKLSSYPIFSVISY